MLKTRIPVIISILSALSCAESTRITPGMVDVLDQEVSEDPSDQSPQINDMTLDMMSSSVSDATLSPADAELDQRVDMSSGDMSSVMSFT